MRRELVVAFALIASLLVVSATPAAAAHGPFVVSTHTTDTDFNEGTLTNMSVVGSGSGATVELGDTAVPDSALNAWYRFEGSGSTVTDSADAHDASFGGDASRTATDPNEGAKSATFDGTGDYVQIPNEGDIDYAKTDSFTVYFAAKTTAGNADTWLIGNARASDSYGWSIYFNDFFGSPDLLFSLRDSSGNRIEVTADASAEAGDGNWHTYRVTYDGSEDGNNVRIWIDGVEQTTSVQSNDAINDINTPTDIYAGAREGSGLEFPGEMDDIRLFGAVVTPSQDDTSTTEGGGGLPAEYKNNHSASNTVEGFANISTADNVTITATWRGDSNGDGSYDTLLNQTSGITSAANHSFTWSEFSGDDVQLNLTVESTGGTPDFTLEGEGVLANTAAPTLDNASKTPKGDITDTIQPTLKIDVNDSDFGGENPESLTVEFYINGSSIGSDTLTSNGTAELTTSPLDGGAQNWSATVSDSYGHSQVSNNTTIVLPSELVFRNESNASERVPATAELTFIADGTIVEKSGAESIDLSGLPVGSKMVVVVQAAGWTGRTVILSDIFTQSDVYLLNDSLTTTTTVFTVEDRTGQYPTGEAELVVERIINQSGTPDWRTVQAEKITGAGILVEMERGERYRFKIRDDDGTVTDLGHITASAEFDGATVNLIVSTTSGTLDEFGGLYAWNTSYEVRDSAADRIRLDFEMVDPSLAADDFRLIVSYQSNGTEVSNVSYGDGVTDLTAYVTLPSDSETYRVDWSATIGGEAYSGTRLVGAGRGTLGEGFCGTALESVWCERIALGGLLVVAGLFSAFNVAVGGVVLSSLAGFAWYFGALPSSIGAGAIILGFALSGLYAAAKGGFR